MSSLSITSRDRHWQRPFLLALATAVFLGSIAALPGELLLVAPATLLSEDLTCIAVGLLSHEGKVGFLSGTFTCFVGIYLGDLGLWALGRLLSWGVLGSRAGGAEWSERFQRSGWKAVLAARFLPGTRLPLYLAIGALPGSFAPFAFWSFLAALLWTPMLVGSVAVFGDVVAAPLAYLVGHGWLAILAAVAVLFLSTRILSRLATTAGRRHLAIRFARLYRWEFWPTWLVYLPLLPWLAFLSLRYRGVLTWTAANPGIPHGGVVGESKFAILEQLPETSVIPTIFVPAGVLEQRLSTLADTLRVRDWRFPLIVKPDAAQRGAGVKLARGIDDVVHYLREQPQAVVIQQYHPGPYEAGVFYYRMPGESRGHIFSITDKQFPVAVGNGVSTLEQLIRDHPRYRLQADVFLARHGREKDRILRFAESFPLALAGNHCQGTMFLDGAHLITPALESRFDAIARHFDGFFIGRFDVRYSHVGEFKGGRAFAIVELNGVTSESTNVYDPSWSLLRIYRTLFRQWQLLYAIGAANRDAGRPPTPIGGLLRLVFDYYRTVRVNPLAD